MARMKKTTSKGGPAVSVPREFVNKLGEMHAAERELTLALPMMVAAAKSRDLKKLLQIHLKETREHVKTIHQIATNLEVNLPMKGCKRMTQLVIEGVKVIGKRLVASQQDTEIIGVGQKIEQFEIESYKQLCATARREGYTHEVALLTSMLNQEKLASELLTALATGKGPLKQLVQKASLKHVKAAARNNRHLT